MCSYTGNTWKTKHKTYIPKYAQVIFKQLLLSLFNGAEKAVQVALEGPWPEQLLPLDYNITQGKSLNLSELQSCHLDNGDYIHSDLFLEESKLPQYPLDPPTGAQTRAREVDSGRQNEATTHLLFIHPNASALVKLGFCGRDDAPESKIKDHKQ